MRLGHLGGYLWSLPNTLLGLLIAVIYVPTSIRWSDGCLEIVPLWILGSPGAQTWGCVIFYRDRASRADGELRVHERVHVLQSFAGGVFFLLAYAAQWLWFLATTPRDPDLPWWFAAYWRITYEASARQVATDYRRGLRPDAWGR